MTKAEFIQEVTDGLLPPPGYFGMNVAMNKNGYDAIQDVMKRGLKPLSVQDFELVANETEALVIDTRTAMEFSKAFIPNSISIGLEGQFAPWVGALIPDVKQEILLITESGKEEETVKRLARVGYDYVIGYLDGGIEAWKNAGKEIDSIGRITAEEFATQFSENPIVIDVRKPGEFSGEHVENALSIPLDFMNDHMAEFPKEEPFILHCAGGYRSIIAGSILKARGFNNFVDVIGGYGAISKTTVPRTDFVCPTTKK
jgi:rhodanese-related sulfurtransferase